MTQYIVVGVSDMDCPAHPGHDCLVLAHGPFPAMNEARDYADSLPEEFRPHVMTLYPPIGEGSADDQ